MMAEGTLQWEIIFIFSYKMVHVMCIFSHSHTHGHPSGCLFHFICYLCTRQVCRPRSNGRHILPLPSLKAAMLMTWYHDDHIKCTYHFDWRREGVLCLVWTYSSHYRAGSGRRCRIREFLSRRSPFLLTRTLGHVLYLQTNNALWIEMG